MEHGGLEAWLPPDTSPALSFAWPELPVGLAP